MEKLALELAPESLASDPYFREKLHEHCLRMARMDTKERVQ